MSNAPRTQQPTGSDISELRPFRVEISDAAIDDLRERLARTRWPEKEPVGDWSMGIPLAYVQELAGYWAKSYATTARPHEVVISPPTRLLPSSSPRCAQDSAP